MKAPARRRPTLHHGGDYREHRSAAYPTAGDGLDALMKGLEAVAAGQPLPADTIAWIEACRAVKGRFKKPSRTPHAG